jgi:hypothetical protein
LHGPGGVTTAYATLIASDQTTGIG